MIGRPLEGTLARLGGGLVSLALALGCASTEDELERVAKDWCMTIRASQVLPVYPLSEDIQPGDVFLVQTSLSRQADIYRERGFLPLDQLVQRLKDLPYADFYSSSYLTGTYAGVPHGRPGWPTNGAGGPMKAPRAAFPNYNFSVEKGSGIQLAIPIQGVATGLGFMGASRATGSVTISDAFTYAVDGESLVRKLYDWWLSDELLRETFAAIVRDTGEPVYLRVVTRVYLTGKVAVSLTNLDSKSAGADVGAAPALELLDLSRDDPTRIDSSAKAYQDALKALSEPLNQSSPGGSVRFTQASRRAVSLDETFDRPLVIGYLGFDVRVFEDGGLSAPIPSYATLNDRHQGLKKAKAVNVRTAAERGPVPEPAPGKPEPISLTPSKP